MSADPPGPSDDATEFAVLLFTDICDSAKLKREHGALEYKRAAELHNALFERLAAEEKLIVVDSAGDGYFARASSVTAAVRFALRFQSAMRTMAWPVFPLTTRVGIHAGEVTDMISLGKETLLAPSVDLAARVMSLAVGGQILLTRWPFDEARHFIRAHPAEPNPRASETAELPALMWLAHGPYLFKGCDEPTEVFEVGAAGSAPLAAPPDSEKAKRAIRPGDEVTLGPRPADGWEIPGRPGWRLVKKLGAGGFGEVWAGEHETTHERRAYKFCFDAERLRALKREVTLVRLLRETLGERDDIVRIYDLRLDEPPYFLETELAVDGNLLQWAEKKGGLVAIPLSTRIELVAASATALAAAHSVGVLHKDVKPTNVLIFTGKDGAPRPRLVDFGIGMLANPDVLAKHGISAAGFTGGKSIQQSTGTPTYSPPEYLAGKPYTVQGDIYALGVMLYQLVTGDATRGVAEGWQRDVPDELLRADIAACVDGDPARRLPTAAELATRLRALATRAAEARRLAAAETTRRIRRRRQRAMTIAAIAGGLIAAISSLWAWSVSIQRAKAYEARRDANHLNAFVMGALREQLEEVGRLDVLDQAAQQAQLYLKTSKQFDSDPGNQAQRLELAHNIARIRLGQGKVEEAITTLRAAIAPSPSGDVSSAELIMSKCRVLNALCDALARTGECDAGVQAGKQALELLNSRNGSDTVELRADVLINLSDLYKQMHAYDEAVNAINESIVMLAPLIHSGAKRPRHTQLRAMLRAGDFALLQGRFQDAQLIFEKRLDGAEESLNAEPGAPLWQAEVALSCDRLAQFWLSAGILDKAAASADKALQLWRDLLSNDPYNLEWLRLKATTETKRAQICLGEQNPNEAFRLLLDAVKINEKLVGTAHGNLTWRAGLATAHSLLSDVHRRLDESSAALVEARTALELRRQLYTDSNGKTDADNVRNLVLSLIKTSECLMENFDYLGAEALGFEGLEVSRNLSTRKPSLPDDRSLFATALETYGETLVGQQPQTGGISCFEEALAQRTALVQEFPDDLSYRSSLAKCREDLGDLYKSTNRLPEARREVEAACAIRQRLAKDFPMRPEFGGLATKCQHLLAELRALDRSP